MTGLEDGRPLDELAAAEVTMRATEERGRGMEELCCDDGIPAETLALSTGVVRGTEVAAAEGRDTLADEDPTEVAGALDDPFMKDAIAVPETDAAVLLTKTRGADAEHGSETAI